MEAYRHAASVHCCKLFSEGRPCCPLSLLVVSELCLEVQISRAAVLQPPVYLEWDVYTGPAFFPSSGAAGSPPSSGLEHSFSQQDGALPVPGALATLSRLIAREEADLVYLT